MRTTRCGTSALSSALRAITSALSAVLRSITSAVVGFVVVIAVVFVVVIAVVFVVVIVVIVIGAVFEGEAIVLIPIEVVVLAKAHGCLGALPAGQQAFGGAVALGSRLTANASCVVASLPGGVVVFGVGIIVAVVREATIVLVVGGSGRRRRGGGRRLGCLASLLLDGGDEPSDRLQARWSMQPRQELLLAMWVVLDELERATEALAELDHIIRVKDRVHIDDLIG